MPNLDARQDRWFDALHPADLIGETGNRQRVETGTPEIQPHSGPHRIASGQGLEHLSLTGVWQVRGEQPGAGLRAELFLPDSAFTGAIHANVPCSVQTALYEAGTIPDPYAGKHMLDIQWVEDQEWWFRRSFSVPRHWHRYSDVRLIFEAVDYRADVWLNGRHLGTHAGSFGGPVLTVTPFLRFGDENVLVVKIDPAPFPEYLHPFKGAINYDVWHLYIHLVTLGIPRPVSLVAAHTARLEHPFIRTLAVDDGEAVLRLDADVVSDVHGGEGRLEAAIHPLNFRGTGARWGAPVPLTRGRAGWQAELRLPDPRRWWPNGMGDQPLYRLDLALRGEDGRLADQRQLPFGVRTLRMQSNTGGPNPEEYDWTFVVNDQPLYVRGANWCPADILLRLPEARYERLLQLARRGNLNMLRLWGGGIPETETFYDLCDRLGLMVWQEFPLFGHNVPYDRADPAVPIAQTAWTVRRLRNRASLIAWAGGNELGPDGSPRLQRLMGAITRALDPSRPYHLTCPWGGDTHLYPHDFGEKPYTAYNGHVSRFCSEFGRQTPPAVETIRGYLPADEAGQWPLPADGAFVQHTGYYGKARDIETMLHGARRYGPVNSLDEFVEYAQLEQGIGLSYALGLFRSQQFTISGTFFYKFNDLYPACSWSVVDWNLIPKPAYDFARRAYAPIVACVRFAKTEWIAGETFAAQLYAVTDAQASLRQAQLVARLYGHSLTVLAERSYAIDVPPNGVAGPFGFETYVPGGDEAVPLFLVVEIRAHRAITGRTVYWHNNDRRPGCMRDLPGTRLTAALHGSGHAQKLTVHNVGAYPAFNVVIEADGVAQNSVFLEDNHFWLEPGEHRQVAVEWAHETDAATVTVRSWNAGASHA